MKKILALLLFFVLTLSLFACKNIDEPAKTKAAGTVNYRENGLDITLPKYLSHEESEEYILYVKYVPEEVEVFVSRIAAETIAESGFQSDLSANDYATLMIYQTGITEAYAEYTGSYEALLPTDDGENAYFAFAYGDPDDENVNLYELVYVRRAEDGSMWVFDCVCNEEYSESYNALFLSWSRCASFYTE